MELTHKCRSVVNYIIEEITKYNEGKTLKERVSLITKRLQKIVYFCEVEYMKRNNGKPLFNDEYYAWPSGPVIPAIYTKFMMYQDGDLKPRYVQGERTLPQDIISLIDEILEVTKEMDTCDLVIISRIPGGPYDKVFDENDVDHKQIISKTDIYQYYSNKNIMFQLKNKEFDLKDNTLECKKKLIRKKVNK